MQPNHPNVMGKSAPIATFPDDKELEFEMPNNTYIKIILKDSTISELPHNLLKTFPDLISVDAQNVSLETIQSNSFNSGCKPDISTSGHQPRPQSSGEDLQIRFY
jgi:hypothetical protein